MRFLVPYDGRELSTAAVRRADTFASALGADVVVTTVVPEGNVEYARERGWLGANEEFVLDDVLAALQRDVREIASGARFQPIVVDRFAPTGTIATRVRQLARELEASLVFVGSANAGQIVRALSSVGGSVAADDAYDVVIVRNADPLPMRPDELG